MLALIFITTFISSIIFIFNYDYQTDWSYKNEKYSIADNTFFYEKDYQTITMANPLGFTFPNRTVKIKLITNDYSESFKYQVFQAIYINKSQNLMISNLILEGLSNELPLIYDLNDNNIYSIRFSPLYNNNLTYIVVDIEYGYYEQGLNYIKIMDVLRITIPISFLTAILFLALLLILFQKKLSILKDPFRINKHIDNREIKHLLTKLVSSEINTPIMYNSIVEIIENVKLNNFHNASLKIFPIIERISNSIIESKGIKPDKKGLNRKFGLLQKWGHLKKVSDRKKILKYRNQLIHGDWNEIQKINTNYLFIRSLQILVEIIINLSRE